MKKIRDNVEQANVVLRKFKGARFEMVSFSKPFNVIEVSLSFLDSDRIAFLTFSPCLYFRGNVFLSDVELRISEDNGIIEITDLKSDLNIKAKGGFVLKEGDTGEFFDDSKLPPMPDFPWEE